MISREICQRVLQKAVSTGADYAEIFAENTVNHAINMISSKVEAIKDTVISGAAIRVYKGLRSIMAQSGCSAEELLYIGDAVSDITACKEAGVRCLSCAWSPVVDAAQLETLNPGLVFSTVEELSAYLKKELQA